MSTTATVIQPPKAAICVVGNEVLSGKTLDTNSNYLAKFLFSRGIDLVRVSVIPDEIDVIVDTVRQFSSLVGPSGYVFTTGGIGPTHDDITYESIANAFNVPLALHEETKTALHDYLVASNRGNELNEDRLRMATFPQGCDVLHTSSWVPIVKMKNVYVLPGIPRLVHQMIESTADHFKGIPIHQAVARTKKFEGDIASALKTVARDYPSVMIGSYVNLKEEGIAFADRSYNVQVTLYSRVEADIHAALPLALAAIDGWVHEDIKIE
ncbi:Aste57867_838 [Aphanomyces stellatus]|uniref:Aste57867_838 protein n=1 Tax=Aphanomyces stellatus TaxID=120398 RepID=A0A485K8W4_9STRA|nr:hypothetical protein As57867_000837 [Aphanomyces stellatus]VFT78062.1 Aste57867_838 [Aphanomyces stellatus]